MGHTAESLGKETNYGATDFLVQNEKVGVFERLFGDIEFNRYGIVSVLLLWNTMLSGITVGLGAMVNYWQLGAIAVTTLALLTWILAVQPMKVILRMAVFATILDIVFIAFNLF